MDIQILGKLDQPSIIPITSRLYRLQKDYILRFEVNGQKASITVPRGFTYDGASIPKQVWGVTQYLSLLGIRPDGLIRAAALVHDWIYFMQGRLPERSYVFYNEHYQDWEPAISKWSRKDADKFFLKIMLAAEVDKTQAHIMYRAVRMFGWIWWDYCLNGLQSVR